MISFWCVTEKVCQRKFKSGNSTKICINPLEKSTDSQMLNVKCKMLKKEWLAKINPRENFSP